MALTADCRPPPISTSNFPNVAREQFTSSHSHFTRQFPFYLASRPSIVLVAIQLSAPHHRLALSGTQQSNFNATRPPSTDLLSSTLSCTYTLPVFNCCSSIVDFKHLHRFDSVNQL